MLLSEFELKKKNRLVESWEDEGLDDRSAAQQLDQELAKGKSLLDAADAIAQYYGVENWEVVDAAEAYGSEETKKLIAGFRKLLSEDSGAIEFGPETGRESYPAGYASQAKMVLHIVQDLLPRIKDDELTLATMRSIESIEKGKGTKDDVNVVSSVFKAANAAGLVQPYKDAIGKFADPEADDEDVEEGNEFSGALAAAKKAGKDEFEVDGKKYSVKEAEGTVSSVGDEYEPTTTQGQAYNPPQTGMSTSVPPKKVTIDEGDIEVDELRLFADNNPRLYTSSAVPIMKNLSKKFKKGVYDNELAKKLWKYHADRAAKAYGEENGVDGLRTFTPADRREAAAEWADEWQAEMDAGNFVESVQESENGASAEDVASAISRRFINNQDLLSKVLKNNDITELTDAIDSVAEFHAGVEELGTSDVSIMVREVLHELGLKEGCSKSSKKKSKMMGEGVAVDISGGKVPVGNHTLYYTIADISQKWIENSAKARDGEATVTAMGDTLAVDTTAQIHDSLIHSLRKLRYNGTVTDKKPEASNRVKLKGFGKEGSKGNMSNPAARSALRVNADESLEDNMKKGLEKFLGKDDEPPFDGGHKAPKQHKDEFGNVIKDKNIAKHLAKKGLKSIDESIIKEYKEAGYF